MTQRSVTHAIFTLERTYPHPVKRVFDAFAIQDKKYAWFDTGDGWTSTERAFDFREGGEERAVGHWADGTESACHIRYLDIIPGERIIYVYEMRINGTKISASLTSIEFKAEGAGTALKLTEQGAYLDGYDDAGSREQGTAELLDAMGRTLG